MDISGSIGPAYRGRLSADDLLSITLYYSPGACSLAPHIALEETGLAFDPRPVVIAKGEHKTTDYLCISPRGRLPALQLDGFTILEAPAILATIAQIAPPEACLALSEDPRVFGRAMEWLCFLTSSVHVAFGQIWRPERFLPSGANDSALKSAGFASINQFFAEIEERCGDSWILGDDYSVVDPFLLVFWRWGRQRLEWDMAGRFPKWTRHRDRMAMRPAVARALTREGLTLD